MRREYTREQSAAIREDLSGDYPSNTTREPAPGVTCSCELPFTGMDRKCRVCGPAGIKPLKRFNIFSDAKCARALRHLATVGELKQTELMVYFHNIVRGKGKFTFAFDRFCCWTRTADGRIANGRIHALGDRDTGCDHTVRHLIERVHADGRRNVVRWIGAPPMNWISSLSDAELYAAFTCLERQFTLDVADAKETQRWMMLVIDETKKRRT